MTLRNGFPYFRARSKKQFAAGMKALGLLPGEEDQLCKLAGAGGYYRRSDQGWLNEISAKTTAEHRAAIEADKTGDGYIYDMFSFELSERDYNHPKAIKNMLDVLGLTAKQILTDDRIRYGFAKAVMELRWIEENSLGVPEF